MQDVTREVDQLKVDIADCERWRDRFYDAIHQGSVLMVSTGATVSFFHLYVLDNRTVYCLHMAEKTAISSWV
jgi:hypothetical protein